MNTPEGWVSDGDWQRMAGFPLSPDLSVYTATHRLAAVATDMNGTVQAFNKPAAQAFSSHNGIGSTPQDLANETIVIGEQGDLLTPSSFVHKDPHTLFVFGLVNRLGSVLWLAAETRPLVRPDTADQYGTAILFIPIPLNSHGDPLSNHTLQVAAHAIATEFRERRAQDYMITLDLENNFLYASRGVEHTLGYDPLSMVGRNLSELVHPEDMDIIEATEQKLGKAVLTARYRIRRSDGNWIAVHSYFLRRPALGGDRYVLMTHPQANCTDMAPLYQTALDTSTNAVIVVDSDGNIIRVNDEFTGATGYDESTVLTAASSILGHDDPVLNERFDSMLGLLFSGAATQFDALVQVRLPDGGRIASTASLTALMDDNSIVRYVVVACDLRSGSTHAPTTVTSKEAIQRAQRDARFRVAMNSTVEGFALVSQDGHVLEANAALGRIIGKPVKDIIGKKVEMITTAVSDEGIRAQELIKGMSTDLHEKPETVHDSGDDTEPNYLTRDVTLSRANGKRVRCRLTMTAVNNPSTPELGYVLHIEDITSAYAVQQQLEYQTTHDLLTQTSNREGMLAKINTMINSTGGCVILYIDIDGFAEVNNSIGSDAGDEVLRIVASRLAEAVGEANNVGRIGADEYLVVLPPSTRNEIDKVIRDILEVVARDIFIGGRRLNLTLSVGSAEGHVGDAPSQLLRDADVALSRVRNNGTSNWAAYDEAMRMEIQRRLNLKEEITRGIEKDEFIGYFQPIVELATRRIIGFETLLRWRRNSRIVSPSVFLSVAEDTGLIVPIGQRVLAQCADFLTHIPEEMFISFNMSAQQFYNLGALLGPHKKLWPRITLEIAESSAFMLSNHSRADLMKVREAGIGLWVDDFGTGFSSIATLRDFPVSGLKVDRSFVAPLGQADEENSQAYGISDSLCRLADNLGIMAIAEGVENRAQAEALQHMGFKYAQGYLLGRPETGNYWAEWLQRAGETNPS